MTLSRSKAVPALLASLVLVLVLGLAACGGGDDSTTTNTVTAESGGGAPAAGGGGKSTAPRAATVNMEDFDLSPATVTIQAGGKVIWKNMGQTAHTATATDGSFDTGTVDPGKLKSEAAAFKQAGTFDYTCTIHPQMHGTIEVTG